MSFSVDSPDQKRDKVTYCGGMGGCTSSCSAAPSDMGSSSPRVGTALSRPEKLSRSECMSVNVTLEGLFAIMNK